MKEISKCPECREDLERHGDGFISCPECEFYANGRPDKGYVIDGERYHFRDTNIQ